MAQQKKSFKNPAYNFITHPDAEQEETQQETTPQQPAAQIGPPDGITIPKGYRLVPEFKSERLQLLVRPEIKEGIKQAAAAQGVSMNELINRILDEYLTANGN